MFYIGFPDLTFLVNFNFFVILFLLLLGSFGADYRVFFRNKFFVLLLFFIALSILKSLFFFMDSAFVSFYFFSTYFYTLAIIFFAMLFASRFNYDDFGMVVRYFTFFARFYLIFAIIFILLYSFLYFSGLINYFGMGANLHYVIPFFIKNGFGLFLVLLSVVLLSGKRAVLINFLFQYLFYFFYRYRNNSYIFYFFAIAFFSVLYTLWSHTELLNRFKAIFDVDFEDSYSLIAAFGGRFEEVIGVVDYFFHNPLSVILGSPPGDFYMYIATSGDYQYNDPKNFSHVGPVAFLFRYGVIFTVLLYASFVYLMIKFYNPYFPFYLVFVGIVFSSFFGANLFSDPISWVFISFFIKYRFSIPYDR